VLIYGSEMVLLEVVIGRCEMLGTDISQENVHPILMDKCQFVACNFTVGMNSCVPTLLFS
jgi:hypothetical protein